MQYGSLGSLDNPQSLSKLYHGGSEVQEAKQHSIDRQSVAVGGWLVSCNKPGI